MNRYYKIVQLEFSLAQDEDSIEYGATVRLTCVKTKYGEDADGNRGILITELDDFEIIEIHTKDDNRLLEECIYYSFEDIIAKKLAHIDLTID